MGLRDGRSRRAKTNGHSFARPPVTSAELAVKTSIVSDYREREEKH
jgi:hypothetical protein